MKVIELAKKKQVSIQDILEICRDLGIVCAGEDSDIAGNDVFLVEKRVQTRNEERVRHAAEAHKKKAEDNKDKKIKLKRKVHVKADVTVGPFTLNSEFNKHDKKDIIHNKNNEISIEIADPQIIAVVATRVPKCP